MVLSCLEGYVILLKGLIAAVFESSQPLYLLRLNGYVGAIRESTDSLICDRVKSHVHPIARPTHLGLSTISQWLH